MNPNLLREARSTPYNIGSEDTPEDERKKVERNGALGNSLNMASSVENFALNMHGIGIQLGSSSSTDLSNFVFYNDSSDPEIIEKWMELYQKQKDPTQMGAPISLQPFRQINPPVNKNFSDSADNLKDFKQKLQNASTSTCNSICLPEVSDTLNKDDFDCVHRHASMDVLPIIKNNFRVLEKCCSVDLTPASITGRQMPMSRLARSKEMPNIFSVIADEDG